MSCIIELLLHESSSKATIDPLLYVAMRLYPIILLPYPPQPTAHGGEYSPSPLDLGHVQLPPSLNDMSRKLAKLAHEKWSCDLKQTDKGEIT